MLRSVRFIQQVQRQDGFSYDFFTFWREFFLARRRVKRSFEIWSQASGSRVGFIGLGNMGGPMAINLIKKGEMDLLVYDVSEENLARVVGEGATATSGPAEIAAECDKIVTMLPNSPHVESVYASLLVSFFITFI